MANFYDKASLVLIPSGTKEGTIFSQKPTNGDGDFTFSRSTSATRVGPSGYIEKETQNLLTYSNDFNGADWSLTGLTATSGQADRNGGTDAWRLEATSAVVRLVQSNGTGGVQTFSLYAKAGNVDIIRFQTQNVGTDIFFDVNAGSIVSAPDPKIDATIEAAGNGFYRCTLTYNETLNEIRISPQRAAFSVLIGDYIYIQDAQLEQGLVARDYIETTTSAVYGGITDNIPRLDYTDTSCPSLLLEPQRTNAFTQSEFFDSSDWTTLSNGETIINNSVISPDGTLNASTLEGDGSSSSIYIRQDVTLNTSVDYTFSIFAKKGTNDFLAVSAEGFSGATNTLVIFDLNNSVVTTGVGNADDYGNGWLRCSYTISISTDGVGRFLVYPAYNGTTRTFPTSGDANGQNIYIYGAQLEQGSYPTSYIPTYGSAVTRNKEICEVTSAADLIGQTEGTIAGEFTFNSAEPTNRLFSVAGSNWSTASIRFDVISNEGQGTIRASGTDIAKVYGTGLTINTGDVVKFAIVYTSTSFKLFINGAQRGSTVTPSGSLPSTNEIVINALGGGFFVPTQNDQLNPYKQVLIFKTALSDEEAIALTTI